MEDEHAQQQHASHEEAAVASEAFPASLQWIERGSALIRRMNSERIAEDPRLKRLLFPPAVAPVSESASNDTSASGGDSNGVTKSTCVTIKEHSSLFGESDLEEEEKLPASLFLAASSENGGKRSVLALTPRESFEEIEADTVDEGTTKQESENTASNAYRVLLWTYRLQASVQSSLQYALSAKTSEDGYFIPICPRFDMGACIFDCGLFDGVKRLHHKPLAYDEFCDGRIASISYCRGAIPAMHSAFVISSTVAAWLDLKESNVAVLIAPNNDQMSVFATCCSLYCTETSTFPENFANELLDVYQQHIRGSESWLPKLQRTFSGVESKSSNYAGGLPRPQARFVADFCKLLETRDRKLQNYANSPALEERKQKLTGIAVTPALQPIYIHQIVLGSEDEVSASAADLSSSPKLENGLLGPDTSRPYFVIQSEKGVLFSSLVNGVRDTNLSSGIHTFKVAKNFVNCGDLVLKMYHLPYGRQGELIFECRLHSSILLDVIGTRSEAVAEDSENSSEGVLHHGELGEITLKLSDGDFDCVSSNHMLPKQFTVRIRFARDKSAFPPEIAALSLGGLDGMSYRGDPSNAHLDPDAAAASSSSPQLSPSSNVRSSFDDVAPPPSQRTIQAKPVRYEGPSVVSFLLSEPNIRTAFGDVVLEKIDVIRRMTRNQLDIYLLFYVNIGFGDLKVLPLRHLFRYVLPEPVRARMTEMGATEESLRASAPSPFDSGSGMTFDEEYARWLQRLYDSDFDAAGNDYDGEFLRGVEIVDVQPPDDYRTVSMRIQVAQETSPLRTRFGRPQMRTRGASFSLINQLPTYTYSAPKKSDNVATPDCLVCRCSFSVGEEIKSLPCFHSYHSECIDSWLCLNKVCPVCQFSIDHAHPST